MSSNKLLYQYLSFAGQLITALALATYIGWWIDKKIPLKFPILTVLLPLLVLIVILLKAVKDTRTKR